MGSPSEAAEATATVCASLESSLVLGWGKVAGTQAPPCVASMVKVCVSQQVALGVQLAVGHAAPQEQTAGVVPQAAAAGFPGSAPGAAPPWALGHLHTHNTTTAISAREL